MERFSWGTAFSANSSSFTFWFSLSRGIHWSADLARFGSPMVIHLDHFGLSLINRHKWSTDDLCMIHGWSLVIGNGAPSALAKGSESFMPALYLLRETFCEQMQFRVHMFNTVRPCAFVAMWHGLTDVWLYSNLGARYTVHQLNFPSS